MSEGWLVVVLLGVATCALKALGPVCLGPLLTSPEARRWLAPLPPCLLAALLVMQTLGGERGLTINARLVGVLAGALALSRGASTGAVVLVAVAATAAARALIG